MLDVRRSICLVMMLISMTAAGADFKPPTPEPKVPNLTPSPIPVPPPLPQELRCSAFSRDWECAVKPLMTPQGGLNPCNQGRGECVAGEELSRRIIDGIEKIYFDCQCVPHAPRVGEEDLDRESRSILEP